LATKIGGALVTWHRTNAADCPLYAFIAVDNPASGRVLEKIGFEHVRLEDHSGVPCALFRLRPGS